MARPAKAAVGRDQRVKINTEEMPPKRTQKLHALEMKHQLGLSQTDLLVKDEDVRRLKVRILMLRDENTTLRDQVSQNNESNASLSAKCVDLSTQLEAKIEVIRSQEAQLRQQEREFLSLKAELQSMNSVTQDSSNNLSEKLALSRELAILKPELEHLRSQLVHQQSTLADKLALERQVNTLEVELANEKKITKRAMQKRDSNDRIEDELRQQLRTIEKQLAAEKAQRERLEDQLAHEKRTHQLALQDHGSSREMESDLRIKMQEVQRQLREAQEEKQKLEQQVLTAQKNTKNQSSDAESELRSQLKEAEGRLLSSQKEIQKVRSEALSSVTEADRRSDASEKKFERLKLKYRELQEQLKQSQTVLRHAQQAPSAASHSENTEKPVTGRQTFKKRKAQDIATDDIGLITIATPGAYDDERPRKGIKKRVIEPTLVGEKSMFSITPFLNRTKSSIDDSPDAEDSVLATKGKSTIASHKSSAAGEVTPTTEPVSMGTDEKSSPEPTTVATIEAEPAKPQLKARGRPKKVLSDASSAKANAQPMPKTALKKPAKTGIALENIAGDKEGNAPEPTEKTQTVKFNFTLPQDTSTSSANDSNTSKGEEPKKKKRKVLGATKTLFDDDEEVVAAPVRKMGKTQLSGVRTKGPLGGVRSAFAGASFSPLKRDRRGVGASFLA